MIEDRLRDMPQILDQSPVIEREATRLTCPISARKASMGVMVRGVEGAML
jgi:hypothetical protein